MPDVADYAHTDASVSRRAEKARRLAAYLWDRDISGPELLGLSAATRRKLARAAGANPPSTEETWSAVAELLAAKLAWSARNPGHPAARRPHAEEKILWVKPPVTPWTS
ncbi:hypothetical protein [Nocardia bovistercoris]|uniref:Uncharacterized protein n=1 Tax=Nocardia bovistercoris TaxID=2785916 RepID=A0A931N2L5_9NOCA|nr:hypothetical protein [Nocardia bovistercoris]MBH0777034.1 hypothetical protein [Nocardia bovistercoris]